MEMCSSRRTNIESHDASSSRSFCPPLFHVSPSHRKCIPLVLHPLPPPILRATFPAGPPRPLFISAYTCASDIGVIPSSNLPLTRVRKNSHCSTFRSSWRSYASSPAIFSSPSWLPFLRESSFFSSARACLSLTSTAFDLMYICISITGGNIRRARGEGRGAALERTGRKEEYSTPSYSTPSTCKKSPQRRDMRSLQFARAIRYCRREETPPVLPFPSSSSD